jgi:hypothetical protein
MATDWTFHVERGTVDSHGWCDACADTSAPATTPVWWLTRRRGERAIGGSFLLCERHLGELRDAILAEIGDLKHGAPSDAWEREAWEMD